MDIKQFFNEVSKNELSKYKPRIVKAIRSEADKYMASKKFKEFVRSVVIEELDEHICLENLPDSEVTKIARKAIRSILK